MNQKKAGLAIACLLSLILIAQLFTIQPVGAVTSKTDKFQPLYEVTVSNTEGAVNGSIVGKISVVAWITYITFDLSSIPNDAEIQSIKFKACSSIVTTGNKFVNVHSVSSDWTENIINWNNRPTDDKLLGTEWIELLYEWYTWDFTNWGVETQNNKLSISMQLSMGMDGYLEFYPKNNSNSPYLEVVYNLPDPTPTSTEYQPIDYVIAFVVLVGIIAVIGIFLVLIFKLLLPKKTNYPPPPPPVNSI